jgi:predicted nuclease of restriction endonuclease-like (RecB) superfamily
MSKPSHKPEGRNETQTRLGDYTHVLADVVELLDASRRASARVVNSLMTATYWEIGRRIVEHDQAGEKRAEYGDELVRRLAMDLTRRFGRGFGHSQLKTMRQFYQTFPDARGSRPLPLQSPHGETRHGVSAPAPIGQSLIGQFNENPGIAPSPALERLRRIACSLPLPWTHYGRLLRVRSSPGRQFYAREALVGGWSVRQLDRQINSQFYERSALSKNKPAMLRKGEKPTPSDAVSADEEIRNPLVLEFLNLKDEYSEGDLEEALIRHLETFLLELGDDFAFVSRQRRLRVGHEWYRVDLLVFHRGLRCLVVIDLKIGGLVHADVGQMNLYCGYAREHWMKPGENPPVGLILCADKDDALARYAMDGLGSKMLIREYRTALPRESALAAELARTRELLERRADHPRERRGKAK